MGEPPWSNVQGSISEYIGYGSDTWGTETSKYPEEKKVKTIPIVAASELGSAQTYMM